LLAFSVRHEVHASDDAAPPIALGRDRIIYCNAVSRHCE
jgi:hypothetical protein